MSQAGAGTQKRDSRWFALSFSIAFPWSLTLNQCRMGHLSWKLQWIKTAIYAICICFAWFVVIMRGALILEEHFILHVSWKLRHSSFHHLPAVVLRGCHKPGSCCVKPSHFERFPGSFRVEKLENPWKSVVFGGTKLSLVEPSSGTSKLSHWFRHGFLGASPLIYPVVWGWWGYCMKDVELLSGNGHPGKAVELWWWNAQRPGWGNEL